MQWGRDILTRNMNTTLGLLALIFYVVVFYVGIPVAVVVGWVRFARMKTPPRTLFSPLSLIGFSLATLSALLAFGSLIYARAIGGFPFYDPRLLRIYRWGFLLSLGGVLTGAAGCWRRSPLRWYAPTCALGMLIFWFFAALGE